MFGKTQWYSNVSFAVEVFEKCISDFEEQVKLQGLQVDRYMSNYTINDTEISVRNPDVSYRRKCFVSKEFNFQGYGEKSCGILSFHYRNSFLTVKAQDFPDLASAEKILNEFDIRLNESRIPLEDVLKNVTVFIGHGRSKAWRDLKDHLQDHHGVKIVAYETGNRAGFTIQEVLRELTSKASLALLVHTGEDVDRDGQLHARENVVHETGLFQGKLGFKRSIVILENGTNEFTNIAGLQQIRFQKDNIKEVFGEVLAVLRREFSSNS